MTMSRAKMMMLLLVLVVSPLCSGQGDTTTTTPLLSTPLCQVCDRTLCPELDVTICPAEVAMDICECCDECARVTGDLCGTYIGRCGKGYHCVSQGADDEGLCQCKFNEPVCGSDQTEYINLCTLHAAGRVRLRAGLDHIHVAYTGPCHRVPRITTPPLSAEFVTDDKGFLSCQAGGVPTPQITWSKDLNNEQLPGDVSNIAIHVRGGPEKNEATSWILINPLTVGDAGTYICRAENREGFVETNATITLSSP